MKQTIVCIFAHPDDEAFGPGRTIALLSKKNDVFIICVTNGDAGKNSSQKKDDLGKIRPLELQNSAKILGVKKVYFLGYHDGTLSNNLYHEIAEKIKKMLEKLCPDTVLTYEPRGISGHIDHIAVSMITSYIFFQLPFIRTMLQYCISQESRIRIEDYFIYFPPGYKKEQIDKVVNTEQVWDKKVAAMNCHESQRHDIDRIVKLQANFPKREYFLVVKKK